MNVKKKDVKVKVGKVQLTENEHSLLQHLSKQTGLSISNLIRQYLPLNQSNK